MSEHSDWLISKQVAGGQKNSWARYLLEICKELDEISSEQEILFRHHQTYSLKPSATKNYPLNLQKSFAQ